MRAAGTNSLQCGHLNPRYRSAAPAIRSAVNVFLQCGQAISLAVVSSAGSWDIAVQATCASSADRDRLDPHVLTRLVAGTRVDTLDCVDDIHPGGDLPEDGVLAVEPGGCAGRDDEELRAVRVRAGVRHREGAAHDLVVVELVLELVAGAARAGAGRVAALDHEVLDHAVEDDAVVESVLGELDEVLHRFRRGIVEKLELDRAVIGQHGGVCHAPNPRYGLPRMGELPTALRDMCGDLA